MNTNTFKALLAGFLILAALAATAQEATLRKNLAERLPQLPKIDEIRVTPVPGLFEIRVNGTEIYYSDAEGNYLIQGSLIDVRKRRNLTEERVDGLTAVKFNDLPLKDALTVVRGNGKRKLAIFADPNCGYCKRLERDLAQISNITVHTFIIPVLGANSEEKSRDIWCAKDKAKAWADWMMRNQQPVAASCDSGSITRNKELGQKHKITGTPTLIFANDVRVPGALSANQIEKLLADSQ